MKAKQIVLNTGKVENLLHVSGINGLVKDAAGGVISNTRVAAGDVTDYQGQTVTTKANEIRFVNARRLENLLPVASNTKFGSNSETSPAPTTGVALTGCPLGYTTGFQYATGCTGFTQRNFTIAADTGYYEWSIVIYNTAPGNGAKFQVTNHGISAGDTAGSSQTYDFDTGISGIDKLKVENLGNNYYRLSRKFYNTSKTTFIFRFDGAATGMDKLIFTGHQLIKFPAANLPTGVNAVEAASIGAGVVTNAAIDGVYYKTTKPQDQNQVRIWGDSIPGASTNYKWVYMLRQVLGFATDSSVGGETSTQTKTRVLASTTTANDLVVINTGRNNYNDPSTVLSDIAAMVATIGHTNYVITAILNRNDTADEYLGGSIYNAIIALNNSLAVAYPNNYVDTRAALVAAYNPNDSGEAAAYALDTTTSRLQSDGLHPSDAGNLAITNAIKAFIATKRMCVPVDITGDRAILHNGDALKIPYSANVNFRHDKGIVILKVKMKQANSATSKALFAANTGATDFIYDDGSGNIALKDGTNTATAALGGWTTNDILLIGACYDDKAGKMSIHVSKNGGAWIDSSDTTYDGAFPAGSNLVWCSSNTDIIEIMSTKVYRSTKGFYKMQNWIKNRAASEAI